MIKIADTLPVSLSDLTNEEQKAVKSMVFDLQTGLLDLSMPGLKFHRLDRAKDQNFWSARVTDGLRLIVYKLNDCMLLCYAGEHRKSYAWAEKRKFQATPSGAFQLVEVQERIQEVVVPNYVVREVLVEQEVLVASSPPAPVAPAPKVKPLFSGVTEATLLGIGVPYDQILEVLDATEESVFTLSLPDETIEMLLNLVTTTSVEQHLPDHKRAILAARYAMYLSTEARKRSLLNLRQFSANPTPTKSVGGRTTEQAAQCFQISRDAVEKARKLLRCGAPEVVRAVSEKRISLSAAYSILDYPQAKQRRVLESGEWYQIVKKIRETKSSRKQFQDQDPLLN